MLCVRMLLRLAAIGAVVFVLVKFGGLLFSILLPFLAALLLAWLVVINLAAFLIFGLDKWRARRKAKNESVRRIPEKTLFLLAVLGGSVGALLGMRVFHHKTLHRSFRIGIPVILVFQLLLAAAALYWTVLR